MTPNGLKAELLENASTEHQREFAKMLAEQCATADLQAKGHRCWFHIPSPTEYEKMKKYTEPPNYDKCPQCGNGRLRVEIFRDGMGDSWSLKCSQNCGFKEFISDDL